MADAKNQCQGSRKQERSLAADLAWSRHLNCGENLVGDRNRSLSCIERVAVLGFDIACVCLCPLSAHQWCTMFENSAEKRWGDDAARGTKRTPVLWRVRQRRSSSVAGHRVTQMRSSATKISGCSRARSARRTPTGLY